MVAVESKPIYLTDRSGAELDDKCGMAFFWNRLAEDGGIVPVNQAEALEVGSQIHEDMELIAELEDLTPTSIGDIVQGVLNEITPDKRANQHQMEILYRRLGWFIAWALFKEGDIRKRWQNIGIEKELILDRTPLWVQVKPDRLLKEREGSLTKYMEYKTTISANQKWIDSWRYAIQIHTSMKAVQEESGQPLSYSTVTGLLKGYYSNADHRLIHPYVWAYYNESSKEWTHSYEQGRSAAWSPRPVWEYGPGLVEWVQRLGPEVAHAQFPTTPPITLNERMLESWIKRRLVREQQIRMVKEIALKNEEIRDIYFEARTNRCKPGFGDACPYLSLCWNADRGRNPLATGDFTKRIPHHDLEAIGVE
jgi:hypothetical protein